jgi:hypothetical protein
VTPPPALSALLSHALVAYTIEFDDEFEHRMPHRTTRGGASNAARYGPWLVSLAMWSNCTQFVSEAGISVAELERLARTRTNLAGTQRWKYVTVTPDKIVRPTPLGRQAQRTWQPPSLEPRASAYAICRASRESRAKRSRCAAATWSVAAKHGSAPIRRAADSRS